MTETTRPDERTKPKAGSETAPASASIDASRLLMAKQFAEVARRTEMPLDALPASSSTIVRGVLWREAAYWALTAFESVPRDVAPAGALSAAPLELLERTVGSDEWLAVLKAAFEADLRTQSAGNEREVELVARFTRDLISIAERPRVEAERHRIVTWLRRAGVTVLALGVLVSSVWFWQRPTSKMDHATRTTSSSKGPCFTPEQCGNASFHTQEQHQPWVMYDLGRSEELHSVKIYNRTDCCYDRVVPLVVETSNDGETWAEQARSERAFVTWSTALDTSARYLRLRIDRRSTLHLERVVSR
jgi:hypothetical protein